MGEKTAIEWTHRRHPRTGALFEGYTMNFWIGCTHAGPECDNCYAESLDVVRFSKMPNFGGGTIATPVLHWGPGAPRHRTGPDNWKKPLAWNRAAIKAGIPLAVFTCSLADFFDQEVPDAWRIEAFEVIQKTTALDWLVLTKRAKYARKFFAQHPELAGLPNVWLGNSIGDPSSLNRLDELQETAAAVRFLSMEPLIADVAADPRLEAALASGKIGWVIVGGESADPRNPASKARPMHPDWVRRIQELCHAYRVPFFFKQWGEWAPAYEVKDPQFQAMCALNRVTRHEFDSGEEGRRYSFKVGKNAAGTSLDGVKVTGLPKFRYAEAA